MTEDVNYLENWIVLNKHVQKLSEETVYGLLQEESKGARRPQFLLRLYGRYNKLRSERERSELLAFRD